MNPLARAPRLAMCTALIRVVSVLAGATDAVGRGLIAGLPRSVSPPPGYGFSPPPGIVGIVTPFLAPTGSAPGQWIRKPDRATASNLSSQSGPVQR